MRYKVHFELAEEVLKRRSVLGWNFVDVSSGEVLHVVSNNCDYANKTFRHPCCNRQPDNQRKSSFEKFHQRSDWKSRRECVVGI